MILIPTLKDLGAISCYIYIGGVLEGKRDESISCKVIIYWVFC